MGATPVSGRIGRRRNDGRGVAGTDGVDCAGKRIARRTQAFAGRVQAGLGYIAGGGIGRGAGIARTVGFAHSGTHQNGFVPAGRIVRLHHCRPRNTQCVLAGQTPATAHAGFGTVDQHGTAAGCGERMVQVAFAWIGLGTMYCAGDHRHNRLARPGQNAWAQTAGWPGQSGEERGIFSQIGPVRSGWSGDRHHESRFDAAGARHFVGAAYLE